jgi:hypothetical protein
MQSHPVSVTEFEAVTLDAQRLGAVRGQVAERWLPVQTLTIATAPPAGTGKVDKACLRGDYGTAVLEVGCSC